MALWLLGGLAVLVAGAAVVGGVGAVVLGAAVDPADPFDGCTHVGTDGERDQLCARFGCPDDPAWKGDRA